MSEGSPWSRLGIIERIIEEDIIVPSNDILVIKDQIADLSRLLMALTERVNTLETESKPPIDNLLEIISPEELGLIPLTVDEVKDELVRIIEEAAKQDPTQRF